MAFRFEEVQDQKTALKRLAELVAKGSIDPVVVQTARKITSDVDSRDDLGEVEAIFDAVKNGTDKVPALKNGLKYTKDPRGADFFSGAAAMLKACAGGGCRADCDEHTVLVASLAAALGFRVGVRAYGPDPDSDDYTHVYAVVALPKEGPYKDGYGGHGMDTTVETAHVGWQPSKGRVLTFWVG